MKVTSAQPGAARAGERGEREMARLTALKAIFKAAGFNAE
jgi:hypothetical protein